jgi:hypothetical protein
MSALPGPVIPGEESGHGRPNGWVSSGTGQALDWAETAVHRHISDAIHRSTKNGAAMIAKAD